MRKLKYVIAAFAVAGMVGCEEEQPPAPRTVSTQSVKIGEPVVRGEPPRPVEPKRPVEAAQVEPTDEEETPIEEASTREILQKARKAIEGKKLDRAMTLAQLACVKAPKRSAPWNTLGRVQLHKGDRKGAIESFEKAVELNPKSSYAQNNLGLALIYDKRYDEAIDALKEATELETPRAEVSYMWNNLGMAYEHLDRLEEARDAYRKAANLDHEGASANLARLEGVKSVFRTAKADVKPELKPVDEVPKSDGSTP
jgi:Flp pilus assembly protein TadD